MADGYVPPLEETLFLLERVIGWERIFALPAFSHCDPELGRAVLTEGAKFAREVLAPLNQRGDEQGSRLVDGRVVTPEGFPDAFRRFAEGGWIALDLPAEQGGQDLPLVLQAAFAEMVNGACVAFGMLPIMLRAASRLLLEHGDSGLVQRTVPRLAAGEWAATICMTEPQAGSDVARLRTRADPQADGSYRLSGTKIFISWGDHDLAGQILHFVLARTPGAPAGTRGISLFLVPKHGFDDDSANGVSVSRVEKKMGLKASPTCVLVFDDAVGYRIGEEGRGLSCMFTMVNLMRLEVAVQGVALAGAAAARAAAYAAERPQGGAADAPPLPIIEHADVRRMLMIMRCRTIAMRALVLEVAFNLDLARAGGNDEAGSLAEFLLPVCKTCAAETGFEVTSLAVQVLGGHGYIADAGIEQYLRDSRVMSIYEGTSGIQAQDLVMRKVLRDGGARYGLLLDRINADLERHAGDGGLDTIRSGLVSALSDLDTCTRHLLRLGPGGVRDAEAAALDYLHLAGLVAGAWMWLRMAAAGDEAGRGLAGFYAGYVLPETQLRRARIELGAAPADAGVFHTGT